MLAGLIRKIDRSVAVMSLENEDGLPALEALLRGAVDCDRRIRRTAYD